VPGIGENITFDAPNEKREEENFPFNNCKPQDDDQEQSKKKAGSAGQNFSFNGPTPSSNHEKNWPKRGIRDDAKANSITGPEEQRTKHV